MTLAYIRLKQLIILSCFFFTSLTIGQSAGQNIKQDVYVDENGVMRWGHNDEEVKGFGVNYSAPFAHGYRAATRLGVDLKKAIDNDVYHFSRLGFDLYRIHVWDTEISDAEGNLLKNEHLELFDYLLKQLKDRDINFVITPIAYWGNGWPEPDEDTPGFSHKYGKEGSLTDPAAIKAQENYLAQFLEHVNPHTGVAYKDEPNIIAFEISNEPHHKGTPEEVTDFVQRMVTSMRSTGTKKPIFYNVSHSTHLMEAYFEADIQGGTFQWYPTGLGFQKELEGNLLPNVNDYNVPFNDVIKANTAAKLVYEFDAADVMKSYIYPAMARSFREAGIQIATHFAWDPTYMAHANTEYNTHYMNLAYTPQKALALMISGEVFREVPINKSYGKYPGNLEFEEFRISYEEDLAEFNSAEKFYYTNTTTSNPLSLDALKHIAGYGNSEVVQYEGRGAYFLDKLEDGVWRLEVMPDAILIDNPFGRNNLDKTVAVINWKNWEMKVELPDLGENFSVITLSREEDVVSSNAGNFEITPGTYLLSAADKKITFNGDEPWKNGELRDFFAPETTVEKTYVLHKHIEEVTENSSLEIKADIVSNEPLEKVEVWLQNGNVYESLELKRGKGYDYKAEVPQRLLNKGFLTYQIVVTTKEGSRTFPADATGNPGQWDFYEQEKYVTRVTGKEQPLYIFNAATDKDYIVGPWKRGNQLVPGQTPGEEAYQVRLEKLFEEDVENKNANPLYDYSFRYNFKRKIEGRKSQLSDFQIIKFKARSLEEKPKKIRIALIDKNGAAFGQIVELNSQNKEYSLKINDLKPVKTVTLPRPYPSFLPYYFDHEIEGPLNMGNVESLQISIGPGLKESEFQGNHKIEFTSFRLEK
ncbi:MAG TPA: cellulase family glycosylhydrolase [Gillisia sp.]|nr:cellulase family glycosylhydrolase [Gillisia sp.]